MLRQGLPADDRKSSQTTAVAERWTWSVKAAMPILSGGFLRSKMRSFSYSGGSLLGMVSSSTLVVVVTAAGGKVLIW